MTDKPPTGPRPPDYVIPARQIGWVIFPEKDAVGLQFEDPSGQQCFVSLDGQTMLRLSKSLADMVAKIPGLHSMKQVQS